MQSSEASHYFGSTMSLLPRRGSNSRDCFRADNDPLATAASGKTSANKPQLNAGPLPPAISCLRPLLFSEVWQPGAAGIKYILIGEGDNKIQTKDVIHPDPFA